MKSTMHPEMKFHYHKQLHAFRRSEKGSRNDPSHKTCSPFFEGWYYKCASPEIGNIAIIFGVSASQEEQQSFIQIVHHTDISGYYTFPLSFFSVQDDPFFVTIGKNIFTETQANITMEGFDLHLEFDGVTPLPGSFWHPSIMGPLLYFKHLPCYHHIHSLRSQASGLLRLKETQNEGGQPFLSDDSGFAFEQPFTGIGYQEKDYGVSFPSGYGWCHVVNGDAMMVVAVAMVPYVKRDRVGFFAVIQKGDQVFRFSSYQLGKVKRFSHYQSKVYIEIEQFLTQLSIHIEYQESCQLRAPKNGVMDTFVEESLDCKVHVQIEKHDVFLFEEVFERGTSEVFEYAKMGFKQT